MYTQLFGQYLLNKGYVSAEKLRDAMQKSSQTRVRLGALAIDAGFMNSEQVALVHEEQRRTDKRFGEIAEEMGLLTGEQTEELLSRQKNSNLVLGQTLTDLGYLTDKQFEKALSEYKSSSSFVDERSDDERMKNDLIRILDIKDTPKREFHAQYILLLVRNLIRFLGDDFTFGKASLSDDITLENACYQDISGENVNISVTVGGCDAAMIGIALRYAGEYLTEADDYTLACVGEFLNLQNGLFLVNVSNESNTELELSPQTSEKNITVSGGEAAASIKLSFPFGDALIILTDKG